jgi:transcriptional regulator with XRE-family HTH domain
MLTYTEHKELNVCVVTDRLRSKGLSPSALAKKIGVSRQIVSQWLQGKKFPRPLKLLQLSHELKLRFGELVINKSNELEPVIAFRIKKGHKIDDAYIEEAKDKGNLLESLVPFLPFDELTSPPTLKKPALDYDYIQKVAQETRNSIAIKDSGEIPFQSLINLFSNYHASLIPVFWGHKKTHENALHIYLPSKMVTWIYLNLDSKIHDFKFWMAHELGHVKAPFLKDDTAEDFADAFAGALLYGSDMAEKGYEQLACLNTKAKQINQLKEIANGLVVSPLTVFFEINKYADKKCLKNIDLESDRLIYKACTNFHNNFQSVAQLLFDNKKPSPREYIQCAKQSFNSDFFNALQKYLSQEKKAPSYIQNLLSIPLLDAQDLHAEMN